MRGGSGKRQAATVRKLERERQRGQGSKQWERFDGKEIIKLWGFRPMVRRARRCVV